MEGPFYVFPSGFAFNADALTKHVLPFLPVLKQVVVNALTQSILKAFLLTLLLSSLLLHQNVRFLLPSSRHLPGF
jgi:hypothetical protein